MIFRLPELKDEAVLRIAHDELKQEGSNFLLDGFEPSLSFEDYIIRVKNSKAGIRLLENRVQSTFLVLEIDGEIVGRVSIRHELNEWLATFGGHIGYAVLPSHRGNGYAKLLLAEGLKICFELGIDKALLTCNDSNLASARVIESAGGNLENKILEAGTLLRRYWVKTQ
jgi:predicted acetyltransferase